MCFLILCFYLQNVGPPVYKNTSPLRGFLGKINSVLMFMVCGENCGRKQLGDCEIISWKAWYVWKWLNRTRGKTNKPKVLAESVPAQKCCFNGFVQVKADTEIGWCVSLGRVADASLPKGCSRRCSFQLLCSWRNFVSLLLNALPSVREFWLFWKKNLLLEHLFYFSYVKGVFLLQVIRWLFNREKKQSEYKNNFQQFTKKLFFKV